jgi:hypothetical protein
VPGPPNPCVQRRAKRVRCNALLGSTAPACLSGAVLWCPFRTAHSEDVALETGMTCRATRDMDFVMLRRERTPITCCAAPIPHRDLTAAESATTNRAGPLRKIVLSRPWRAAMTSRATRSENRDSAGLGGRRQLFAPLRPEIVSSRPGERRRPFETFGLREP